MGLEEFAGSAVVEPALRFKHVAKIIFCGIIHLGINFCGYGRWPCNILSTNDGVIGSTNAAER